MNGEFHVALIDHDDIFDVSPKLVYNVGNILIRVLNGSAIDYETRQVFEFKVSFIHRSLTIDQKSSIFRWC